MGQGQPIPMNLKVGGFAAERVSGRSGVVNIKFDTVRTMQGKVGL